MTSVVLLWTSVRDTWSFRHPILMAAHKSTTANFSLITDGVHCPPKRLWLIVLPTASQVHVPRPLTRCHPQCCPFQTAYPLPSLWDRNMEPQLLPYLWFVWSWWWCPDWTACYFPLHTPPYSVSSQEPRMFLLFCTRTATDSIFSTYMNSLFFMSRLAVARFDWRLFLVNLVNLVP